MRNNRGFTLVEILVALFIFAIVSMILVSALRSVIATQSRTDLAAAKLGQLQMALLITSRDLQQAVNRPITNTQGRLESAFSGTSTGFKFTHMGNVSPMNTQAQSVLQRTDYVWHDNAFWRQTWPTVDQAPNATSHERLLMPEVESVDFQYLDPEGHFQHDWPSHSSGAAALPRAVKLTLTIINWGTITQVYLVPAGEIKHALPQAPQESE